MQQRKYVTIAEYAKEVGLSRSQVFRRVQKGEIQAERFGRAYLIPLEELAKITGEITEKDRELIKKGVKRALNEYGDVIRKLGDE